MVNLKYLQKLLFLLVMGFSISVVCACSDEDDGPVYYVKYEVDVDYYSSSEDYTLRCEFTNGRSYSTNIEKYTKNGESLHWEGVYGPFEKGDHVSLECGSCKGKSSGYNLSSNYGGYGSYGEYNLRIYVKEGNDGDFVVKDETSSGGSSHRRVFCTLGSY